MFPPVAGGAVRAWLQLPSCAVPVLDQRAAVVAVRAGLIPAHGPDVAARRTADGVQADVRSLGLVRVRRRHDRPLRTVPVLDRGVILQPPSLSHQPDIAGGYPCQPAGDSAPGPIPNQPPPAP